MSAANKKVNMIGGFSEQHLMNVAKDAVEKKTKNTVILDRAAEDRIPRFLMSEVTIDKVLGRGGFCVVQEITKIQLQNGASLAASSHHHDDTSYNENNNDDDDDDEEELEIEHLFANLIQDRNFMARNYKRRGKDYRYALKMVQDSIKKDAQTYINGIVDLAIEARFLSVIRHSNIIKMRAMAIITVGDNNNNNRFNYYDPQFFVILDKLYDILSTRLCKTWKKKMPTKMSRLLDRGGKKELAFWLERLTIGYDLSCALKYLHDLHILYRDIKPDNIGFDVRGDVKIFDFGLAKEIHPKDVKDGAYKLTGDTGSPRYMAPEVALNKPYNETCDVYSFCILLWQILKVETPFEGFTMKLLTKKVTVEGVRPKPDDKAWPAELCSMLRLGWHADLKQRPSMETISDTLRDVINKYSDEEINEIMDASRKSELSLRRGSGNSVNLDSLRTPAAAAPGTAAKATPTTKSPTRNENLDDSSSSAIEC